MATVVLTGVLAASLGGVRTGTIAMGFAAVCPALVSRASNIIVDTFAAFFALLALYFCRRLERASEQKDEVAVSRMAGLAGGAVGLAFASKYTALVVFAAVLATIAMLRMNKARKVRLCFVAGAGFLISAFLGTPSAFIKPFVVLQEVLATAHNYTTIYLISGILWAGSFRLGARLATGFRRLPGTKRHAGAPSNEAFGAVLGFVCRRVAFLVRGKAFSALSKSASAGPAIPRRCCVGLRTRFLGRQPYSIPETRLSGRIPHGRGNRWLALLLFFGDFASQSSTSRLPYYGRRLVERA